MAKKKTQTGEPVAKKPSLFVNIAAAIAGMLAVKLASYIVTTLWRLITREDPPQVDMAAPVAKKAAWVALVGAATGAARQSARDIINPPVEGPA